MNHQETPFISHKTAIWFGIAGILGSIILFAGDMLFYYNGDSGDYIINIGNTSPNRLMASGITALISAWLYTLGAGQVYYAFQPAKRWARLSVFFAFASVMITYGIVHAAYVAIGTSAINAIELGHDPYVLSKLAVDINEAIRLFAYPSFAIFTLVFIPAVWKKTTHYPRWMILCIPAIPFLFADFINNTLQGSLRIIIAGGYLNLMLLLFFSASTIALWNKTNK